MGEKRPFYKRVWPSLAAATCVVAIVGAALVWHRIADDRRVDRAWADGYDKGRVAAEERAEVLYAPEEDAAIESEEPAEEPAKPKQWAKVHELSGNANKRGETFTLEGGDARLKYAVRGSSVPVCSIYLMESGVDLKEAGGFPEVMVTQAGKDSTMIVKDAGDYYLDVSSANCSWDVIIEEKR